ncbi:MAG: dCTP deaminase [Candidatus Nealsonbacteria bacterium]|nr:dCTP deaminase [Candidatus Nealsonbacteria bacterium]
MILTHDVILEEIKKGNIKITPFDAKNLGPASYDLALGNSLRIFVLKPTAYAVDDKADYNDLTKLIDIDKSGYTMRPGETLLGTTVENINLAPNIAGWLEGRSRFARLGLMVHISAPFMQPGINNREVLEIANLSPTPLTIFPGTKICQFVFEYCQGKAVYKGRFKSQKSA